MKYQVEYDYDTGTWDIYCYITSTGSRNFVNEFYDKEEAEEECAYYNSLIGGAGND